MLSQADEKLAWKMQTGMIDTNKHHGDTFLFPNTLNSISWLLSKLSVELPCVKNNIHVRFHHNEDIKAILEAGSHVIIPEGESHEI